MDDNVAARLGLARLLATRAETRSEAEDMLRTILADPKGKAVCGVGRELAELLVHKGDEEAAAQVVADTLEINEDCLYCLLMQGQICARRGGRQLAMTAFDAALKLDSDSVTALTGLALTDPDQAAELIDRAMTAEPNNPRTQHGHCRACRHR